MRFRIATAVFVTDDGKTFAQGVCKIDNCALHSFLFTTRSLRSPEHTETTEKEKVNRSRRFPHQILRDLRVSLWLKESDAR